METYHEVVNADGFFTSNEHLSTNRYTPPTLSWLDLRVFYVRLSKCELHSSTTPHHLTMNHIPLDPNTLLEINGVRPNICNSVSSTILRRDRIDKKSDDATFVSTDSVRLTGTVKFEVLDNELVILSGILNLDGNGYVENEAGGRTDGQGWKWSLNCEVKSAAGFGFLKRKRVNGSKVVGSPMIEVCLAGSFSGDPIILCKTLKLSSCSNKVKRNRMLNSIPESDDVPEEQQHDDTPSTHSTMLELVHQDYRSVNEGAYNRESEHFHLHHSRTEYLEGEDMELSWFNAGLRVGVGIGLSICLGIGIGVGLVAKNCHGTSRTFRRRLP